MAVFSRMIEEALDFWGPLDQWTNTKSPTAVWIFPKLPMDALLYLRNSLLGTVDQLYETT